MTQATEWALKVITTFGGNAFTFLIDNDTLVKAFPDRLIAEPKAPIRIPRWANKTAQSAMTKASLRLKEPKLYRVLHSQLREGHLMQIVSTVT